MLVLYFSLVLHVTCLAKVFVNSVSTAAWFSLLNWQTICSAMFFPVCLMYNGGDFNNLKVAGKQQMSIYRSTSSEMKHG
jgi:hypothetical protein